jgi:hypothetical protein
MSCPLCDSHNATRLRSGAFPVGALADARWLVSKTVIKQSCRGERRGARDQDNRMYLSTVVTCHAFEVSP